MPPVHPRAVRRAILLTAFIAGVHIGTGAALAETPRVRIARLPAAPTLDEVAAGRIPDGMAKVTGFVQREPGDGTPVSRETTAYVGYDDSALHVVFVCKEDPGVVRAHMSKRESIMGDDVVGLILDTFHDRRHGYVFIVNPLGIQMDGITTEGQNDDYSFDTVWESSGRLTPDGFVVRIAIPFRSLRFSSADVQTWGISLARILPTRNETSFWPRMTRTISSQTEQMADLEGIERTRRAATSSSSRTARSPGRDTWTRPRRPTATSRKAESASTRRWSSRTRSRSTSR